jgi:SAM-dependent methyltransferase
VHQYFDRVAESYDQGFDFFAHFGMELARFAGINGGTGRVLDVACGRGAVGAAAHALSGGTALVIGIDSSVRMLRAMRAQPATPIAPMLANAAQLPCGTGLFDVVLCGFALHIMPEAERVLAEMHRVLRPGGTFAFSVPGPASDNGRWDFYAGLIEAFKPYADPQLLLSGPTRPLDALVAEAGFTDLHHGHAEVHLPLNGADDFWAWHQSHGARALVDALPPAKRKEFREDIFRQVRAMAATGPVVLDRGAVLTRGQRA